MKIISPKFHAILDYVTVLFLWIAPSLINLSPNASKFSYILGGVHLLLTVLTNFSGGVVKVIPFKIHGLIELLVGILLLVLAFTYFSHSMADHLFCAALAIVIAIVFVLTDFKSTVTTPSRDPKKPA